MTPPSSIDGTDITGATIDGQDVQEITVDGQTVFTAITDTVIHRYTFENNSNTTTLTDTVGSANGAITGMTYTTSLADGEFAGNFDGENDDVTNLPTESPPISYTFDVFQRDFGTIFAWGFNFGNDQGIVVKVNSEGLEVVYGNTTRAIILSQFSLNTRHHVGVTISGSDDITVYIDGSQEGSTTSSNSGFGGSSSLGSELGKSFGDLILDDFTVDNTVLTQSEVQARI
jgi:hypothetical protein